MTIPAIPGFIVIDDDPFYNVICRRCIEITFPGASVTTFTNPFEALEHIRSAYNTPNANRVFAFLDINMPHLSGWDVLNEVMSYPEAIKRCFTIFIMSSSVALRDKQAAEESPIVSGYIEKPLTKLHLQTILAGYN